MKDRFRFRAWYYNKFEEDNSDNNKYFYEAEDTYDFLNDVPATSFGDLLHSEFWTVEQCTGLKDKNGKLIYEGDIIKDLTFNEEDELAIIKFGDSDDFDGGYQCFYPEWLGKYSKRTKYSMGWRRGLVWWCNSGIEVIGNIHENPELLEADNAR